MLLELEEVPLLLELENEGTIGSVKKEYEGSLFSSL